MVLQQFLILQAIIQNVLYIYQPYHTTNVYICFDKNGDRNDTWPDNWDKMNLNNSHLFNINIPETAKEYKLKAILLRNNTVESDWKKIRDPDHTEQPPLLIYTAIMTSLVLCLMIVNAVVYRGNIYERVTSRPSV